MEICTDLLTVDQLADELGITRRTLERWHAERSGPPRIKFGKQVRYRADSVRAWLLERESFEPRAA